MAGDSPGWVTGAFPDVRYADADGVSIAYSVRGDGPLDLVMVPGNLAGILSCIVDPQAEAHFAKLERFARVIQIDRRGLGMSDPIVAGGAPPLEQQVADVLAVMDAVGSDRAAIDGSADGGMVAILFAAMHPIASARWCCTARGRARPKVGSARRKRSRSCGPDEVNRSGRSGVISSTRGVCGGSRRAGSPIRSIRASWPECSRSTGAEPRSRRPWMCRTVT